MTEQPGLILVADLQRSVQTLRAAGLSVAVVDAHWEESTEGTLSALTAREVDVLALLASGFSYQQIAKELGISSKTVGTYVQRIREKTRSTSRQDLVALANRHGLMRI